MVRSSLSRSLRHAVLVLAAGRPHPQGESPPPSKKRRTQHRVPNFSIHTLDSARARARATNALIRSCGGPIKCDLPAFRWRSPTRARVFDSGQVMATLIKSRTSHEQFVFVAVSFAAFHASALGQSSRPCPAPHGHSFRAAGRWTPWDSPRRPWATTSAPIVIDNRGGAAVRWAPLGRPGHADGHSPSLCHPRPRRSDRLCTQARLRLFNDLAPVSLVKLADLVLH